MVDAGIKAAEWSPDEELLILITGTSRSHTSRFRKIGQVLTSVASLFLTGDDMLLEMTKDFEVLKDAKLRSEDFGEGRSPPCLRSCSQTLDAYCAPFHSSLPLRQVHQRRLGV